MQNRSEIYGQMLVIGMSVGLILLTLFMDWIRFNLFGLVETVSGLAIIQSLGDLAQVMGGSNLDREALQLAGINETIYLILVPIAVAIINLATALYGLTTPATIRIISRIQGAGGLAVIIAQLAQLAAGLSPGLGFWLVMVASSTFVIVGIFSLVQPQATSGQLSGGVPTPASQTSASEFSAAPLADAYQPSPVEDTMEINPAPSARDYIKAWLVDAQNESNYYQLYENQSTIGRSERNDIILPSRRVSRDHAIIYERNGFYTLENLSQQGTEVNDQIVHEQHRLYPNDLLTFGDYAVYFLTDE